MKIGLITGIGKGIGLSLTKSLIRSNVKVIGINRSENADIIKLKKNNNFKFYKCDVSNYSKINQIIDKIFINYGPIDFVVNNAGIRARAKLSEVDIKNYQNVFNINTLGPINITKKIIDKIYVNKRIHKELKVINLSSIVGLRGFKDLSVYACSKAALDAFTKSISLEYAKYGLVINSIAPGFFKTSYFKNFKKNKSLYNWTIENIPMKRWGEESELVELLLFLIESKSNYLNGSVITIDGGWTAK